MLNKWEKGDSAKQAEEDDEDTTTEEEVSDYYDFDFSF